MSRLILRLNHWMSGIIPDAFSLAIILTLLVALAAKWLTAVSWSGIISGWGDGFWSLMSFAMQMSLVMLTGFIVGHSPLVRSALEKFSGLAKTERGACALMAFSSMALAWIHWGLCIAGSALLVRFIALRHSRVHYPLLVACAYFGMGAVWHAGLSGSAPLLVATPGHFLEASIGVLPLNQTIFSAWNLALLAVTSASLTLFAFRAYPSEAGGAALPSEALLDKFHEEIADRDEREKEAPPPANFAERLDRGYLINAAVSAAAAVYLFTLLSSGKWVFDLNLFNFIFLSLSIALHPNVRSFLQAAQEGAHTMTGIILQFPFYAGMYGIIKSTGLSEALGRAFTQIAGAETFPLAVYLYSGVLNYFVPSGGSKWAIEAPYLIEAAKNLGVPMSKLVLSYSWGDMVTDLIQPFFCLPLLSASGMEFRQLMGYLTAAFLLTAAIGSAGVLLLGWML